MGIEPPKVIFLDAVGTLFGVRGSVGDVYSQLAAKVSVMADPNALNPAFVESFQRAPAPIFPDIAVEQIPEQEYVWWEAITRSTFEQAGFLAQFDDFGGFFRQVYDYFATAEPWVVYDDVLTALSYWREEEIELGIISNFDTRLHHVLENLQLKGFFQSITLATLTGAAKPDPQIFTTALNKHLSDATQAWHIGDSIDEDYKGALAAGLTSYWLNRQN